MFSILVSDNLWNLILFTCPLSLNAVGDSCCRVLSDQVGSMECWLMASQDFSQSSVLKYPHQTLKQNFELLILLNWTNGIY